jgi:hypothetical protein
MLRDGRNRDASGEGDPQCQIRPRAKLLAPIGGGIDLLFEFAQVDTEALPRLIDVRLYLVDGFIHSRFSFNVSTVRLGIG